MNFLLSRCKFSAFPSVFLLVLCVLVLFSLTGQECFAQGAQDTGKDPELQEISDKLFRNGGWLGPGGYFSPIKLSLYIFLFLFWVGTASWINADQERLRKENREKFNFVYLLMYGIGGTAIFFIPIFWLAISLTALICFVPSLAYVIGRNRSLPPGDQVLTPEHLWYLFAVSVGKIGIKVHHGPRTVYSGGPPLELEPLEKGADHLTLQGRLILARNAPGYNLLREHIYDAIESRATAVRFDFSTEHTKIWHLVDGAWLELVPVPRKLGRTREKDIYEEMQEAAKKLIGANPEDRRSKQAGQIRIIHGTAKKKVKPKKFDADYISQGTTTGEAAIIQLHSQTIPFKTLGEIGVREEVQPALLAHINGKRGIVLVSAPPTNGLRSTMAVYSKACDRFTKDVANVEDVNGAGEPIENVISGLYDSSKGEVPMKPLADLLFRGISTIFVRDMSSPDTIKTACEALLHDDRLFITMLRAKDGIETLKQFLSVDYPATQIVPHINAVICQRLIRLLCTECKEAYEPDPKVLQQLRLNPEQVKQLYRKRTPLPPNEEAKRGVCHKCHGVGYFGRTALFEFLLVSDTVKTLLLSKADNAAIRQQFNQEGQPTFLHEGIRLLLKGETAVDELSRILKM